MATWVCGARNASVDVTAAQESVMPKPRLDSTRLERLRRQSSPPVSAGSHATGTASQALETSRAGAGVHSGTVLDGVEGGYSFVVYGPAIGLLVVELVRVLDPDSHSAHAPSALHLSSPPSLAMAALLGAKVSALMRVRPPAGTIPSQQGLGHCQFRFGLYLLYCSLRRMSFVSQAQIVHRCSLESRLEYSWRMIRGRC